MKDVFTNLYSNRIDMYSNHDYGLGDLEEGASYQE
jgi:hypothetical protein